VGVDVGESSPAEDGVESRLVVLPCMASPMPLE
jgi:hypothetical protein